MSNDDDLNLVLTVDPDTSKVKKDLEAMGILLDKNSEIAGKEMIAALDAQKSQLEKINALMNPSFLKERIKLEQEVRKQKEQLAALENEEYSKYLKPALTTAQEHQKVLEEINKLNDPKELADRVRMEQEIAQAKKQLASSEEQERSKYIPVLTALEKHKQTLEEINKLNDPKLIADRLRMEKEIADAKRAIANTEASIKRDIEPPKSANALKEIQDRVRLEFQELEVRRWITQEEAKERSYLVMNAQAIEDTVKAERELLALRKQEDDALSKERKRQSTPEEQLQQIGSASGYAGSAIGKSIGGETGGQLGAIVGKAIENIGGSSTIAASGLGLLSSALGGLNSALGPITGGLDLASDIMGSIATGIGDNASQVGQVVGMAVAGPIGAAVGAMLGDALGKQLQQLAKIPAVIGSILSTLTGFAAKASPGQMTMLTMAIDDTQAIIGQSFLPMMELMREAIKFVGDTIATIIPSYDEVQSALAGVRYAFQQVGNEVKNFLQEFGPTIKVMLVNSIKLLGIAATMAAQGLTALIADYFGEGE